jgi:orotidine-5'-phosphate decarboxylase
MGSIKNTANFADRLTEAQKRKNSLVVLGIDPQLGDGGLPHGYRSVAHFCCDLISACADVVVAIKPQLAFFEARGISGMRDLRKTIAHARLHRLITIADAKRGDIGLVSKAYAEAYLGDTDFSCDAVTVNPYLGRDSIEAFLPKVEGGRGIFVCVKTSNKSSKDFQDLRLYRGGVSWRKVGKLVSDLGENYVGSNGLSSVGAVFGATHPKDARAGRNLMPTTLMLVPGYGAQGASASDAIAGIRNDGLGVVVNASRSIMYAWQTSKSKDPIQAALDAAEKMRRELNEAALQLASGRSGDSSAVRVA